MKKLRNRLIASFAAILSVGSSGLYSAPVYASKTGADLMQQIKVSKPSIKADSLSKLSRDEVDDLWGMVTYKGSKYENLLSGKDSIRIPLEMPNGNNAKTDNLLASAYSFALDFFEGKKGPKIYSLANRLLCYENGKIVTWGDIYPDSLWKAKPEAKKLLYDQPVLTSICAGLKAQPKDYVWYDDPAKPKKTNFVLLDTHPKIKSPGTYKPKVKLDEGTFGKPMNEKDPPVKGHDSPIKDKKGPAKKDPVKNPPPKPKEDKKSKDDWSTRGKIALGGGIVVAALVGGVAVKRALTPDPNKSKTSNSTNGPNLKTYNPNAF